MVPMFSCYPSGTILLRTKASCPKRMRKLISISVDYMLGLTIHFIHNYTRTSSAFPCGKTQHVRCMRSSVVIMIQSVLEVRFMRALPHSRLNGRSNYISGNVSSPFQWKGRFCDSLSFGIIPISVQKCRVLFSNYFSRVY